MYVFLTLSSHFISQFVCMDTLAHSIVLSIIVCSDIHNTASPTVRFLVRASYLQIYNEIISDLLKPERTNLSIREDKKRGVFVEGLSEWVVRSPAEIYGIHQSKQYCFEEIISNCLHYSVCILYELRSLYRFDAARCGSARHRSHPHERDVVTFARALYYHRRTDGNLSGNQKIQQW